MQALIISNGKPWEAVASSSLIKRFRREHKEINIILVTKPEYRCMFKYNKNIDDIFDAQTSLHQNFDIAINVTPDDESGNILKTVSSKNKYGFLSSTSSANKGAEDVLEILLGNKVTKKNYFQLIIRAADIIWKGDGYDLSYYPKSKMRKRKTGIAVKDDRLRKFVKDNLVLNCSELWHIPIRKDLLKRLDEINRVRHIITDDLFFVHAGIAMKKHVEFLDIDNLNMSIEFFGKGHHHAVKNDFRNL